LSRLTEAEAEELMLDEAEDRRYEELQEKREETKTLWIADNIDELRKDFIKENQEQEFIDYCKEAFNEECE